MLSKYIMPKMSLSVLKGFFMTRFPYKYPFMFCFSKLFEEIRKANDLRLKLI